jgi:hypothetical protein
MSTSHNRAILSLDTVAGIQTTFNHNIHENHVVLDTKQDVTEMLELNKAQRNGLRNKRTKKFGGKFLNHVARVDMVTMMELQRLGIWQDDKRLMAWLNDPMFSQYRTDDTKL